jgi:membrane protease YdiL (CAAX protease family)
MLSEKQWQPWQVLMLGVLVLLSLIGGVLTAAIVIQLAKPYLTSNNASLVTLIITVLGFHGAALVWVHFFLRRHGVTWGEAFGFARGNHWQALAVALIALPIVLIGVFVLGNASEWVLRYLFEKLHWAWLKPEPQPAVQLLMEQWPAHLMALQGFVAIVLAPFSEEVLFRGILYTTIKQRGHRFAAIWLSALLFATIHFYPVGFLSLIFLAVVLVAVYEWTKNLLAPILLHALFNAANFIVIVTHPKWAEQLFQT